MTEQEQRIKSLEGEVQYYKAKIADLEYRAKLDMSEIARLRRQIETLEDG